MSTHRPMTRPLRSVRRLAAVAVVGAMGALAVADGASANASVDVPGGVPAVAPGTNLAAVAASAGRAATASTTDVITTTQVRGSSFGVTGRGTYHSVGLGQWGALGYAVRDGWTASQILDHYYGGTVEATVRTEPVTMLLSALADHQTAVVHERGRARVIGDPQRRLFSSLVAREVAPQTYDVWGRTDATVCPSAHDSLGGWVKVLSGVGPHVTFRPGPNRPATTNLSHLLGVCEPSGTVRYYRGAIRALNNADGGNRTINIVPMEQLLRSTVAWEMSPSWADHGGGRGMEALRAQAVAARSYILAYAWYAHARTCDNICVAYRGAASRAGGLQGTLVVHEDSRADAAVASTAGIVRRRGSASGPIALTMYSASTGGWTAAANGLASYPLVEDLGDDYRAGLSGGNPWRNWTRSVSVSTIQNRWPQVGRLESIDFSRNGRGEWGGRVLGVTLVGSSGSVRLTGDTFPRALGLPSNWFELTPAS